MARNTGTDEIEAEATSNGTANEVELDEDAETALINGEEVDLNKLMSWFPTFRAPVSMRLLLEEKAAESKLNVPQYIKNLVATAIGFELQPSSTRSGTMTAEQKNAKKEEYKAKAKAERARVKAILDAQREPETAAVGK